MAWNTSGRVMFASLLLSGCVAGVSEVHHSEADPDRPHDTSRGFRNFPLTGEDPFPGFAFLWRRLTQRWNLADLPPDHLLPPEQAVAGRAAADGDDSVTWIGHASFFLEIGGRHVLTDLVYADSVSPFGGFRRFVPPGLPRDALPRIDVVVISHNHHDHLDENFLRELAARDPETVAVVPLGLARVLRARGFALVHELDWGEHVDVAGLRFFAHSAMHESGRGMSDENRTLWATWVISTGRRTVLFAGDTGYSSTIFPWIGESHAKFDLGDPSNRRLRADDVSRRYPRDARGRGTDRGRRERPQARRFPLGAPSISRTSRPPSHRRGFERPRSPPGTPTRRHGSCASAKHASGSSERPGQPAWSHLRTRGAP